MLSLIEQVKAKIAALVAERALPQAQLDTLIETVEARGDAALTADEQAELDAIRATVKQIDEDVEMLTGRLDDLEADENAKVEAAKVIAKWATNVEIISEPRTYTAAAERRGVNIIRDLVASTLANDWDAAQRLSRHKREAFIDGVETRDVGTGAFAGLTVPQYLVDLYAPTARAGRPVADVARNLPLPPDGMTVNISRITTGSGTAAQTAENAAIQETDMDDTLLVVDVRTIAGQQDVSRQAIDRGAGVEAVILQDLIGAYNTNLDNQILNGSGASGQHLGIRNVSGIIAVAYTDATPTAAELYPKFADLIQQVENGAFAGVTHFVMHARRWWWIAKELGSTFPLVQFPNTAPQVAGNAGGSDYRQEGARNIFGVPVILDNNIPTNLGAGTNEDVILGITADQLFLWEDPAAPMFIRAEQPLASNLAVRLVVWGYSAFTAGRYPAASGTIGGTGLVLPVF